jgi:hypothetical protein
MQNLKGPREHGFATINEWAEKLDKHPRTIRRYCQDGLEHSKLGGECIIHEDAWPRYLASKARGGNRRVGGRP